jgi:hypothetical protein
MPETGRRTCLPPSKFKVTLHQISDSWTGFRLKEGVGRIVAKFKQRLLSSDLYSTFAYLAAV